ncbi:PREDICTED: uncharacterized protein LOC100637202 [Amphimedon queenslandica]|uniref:Uncharacterized protein n=1 Tax=Amphimedon queenslandica TaxID=400682 RepID=A0A1X7V832_AMPQE|nr:PREDICTED: uncharacterized protein LOC100637202 [Amphimedon queenslandica]|eukprot:XP_003385408.1 PREDICTED: uncharacterized protein LOC100637202 [Amphimedon queenslandica]
MGDKNVAQSRAAYRECNQVVQEEIWKENVKKEEVAAKKWEKNWGFMAELDLKGNPVKRREPPKSGGSFYKKSGLPVTTSQTYGMQSRSTPFIMKIERLGSHHKRKTDVGTIFY